MSIESRVWGEVALLLAFLGFTAWYVQDSYSASSSLSNMLLIGPVGGLALAIGLVLLVSRLVALWRGYRHWPPRAQEAALNFRHRYGVGTSMTLLVLYVVGMPFIGFDLATFLFLGAAMLVYGERRLHVVGIYAAIMSLVVVSAMKNFLFVPFPTLLPL